MITYCFILSFLASLFDAPEPVVAVAHRQRINKVLILGNSITLHGPLPSLGWYGNWGMAATCQANDYVHLLEKDMQTKNKEVKIMFDYVGNSFERKFWMFDTADFVKYRNFAPDLILIRLGENIEDSLASKYDLQIHLRRMIRFVKGDQPATVVCTGSFWPRPQVDKRIGQLCEEQHYMFIPMRDLYDDPLNLATKEFKNWGVAQHPSDHGMQQIETRIWENIQTLFE